MKTLIIDRKKWGTGFKGGKLLDLSKSTNRMCCLGFVARQMCGAKTGSIRGIVEPCRVSNHSVVDAFAELGLVKKRNKEENTGICGRLMEVNDKEHITDEKREAKITSLFRKLNIKVKFIN